jgi:type VI secretion system secreted protein VgrG
MPPPVMKLTTDLGDTLRFRSLAATEEMARLFDFSVLALSDTSANVSTDDLLGTKAAVTIELGHDGPRHFHGIVSRAGLESANGNLVSWRLQLRPRLWLLTRRSDSRIFQDKTVEAIIKDVFTKYSGLAVKWQLTGTYAARPYCVQYRETDFNFVSRLMEEEGMYYFHEHTANEHTLVIVDSMTKHQPFGGYADIKYRESIDQMLDLEAVTEWRLTHELTSGKSTLVDYDYLKPATSLLVNHDSPLDSADATLSHYDFPGLYTETARGNDLARVRQQELDARSLRITGYTSTVMALTVGYSFTLKDHPLDSENVNHVVTSTRIDAQYAGYESGQGQTQFSCRFGAMRYAHVFRPERITPKPIIPGPQTAVVVGPSGQEIYTDEHGRAKVQFHWDRLNGANDHDKKSCWLRVSSAWAGKAWGAISLPRIGQEVVVDFLEGDPDLPLITGRVYNAVQVPPYTLPDNKTVSTLKSQSSIGGTTANANELRFEDKKGEEYVWFQAEKDMRHLVKHNSNTWIKANEHRIVGGNFTEKIGGKQQITVEGIGKHLVKGNYNFRTNADGMWEVLGKYSLWVDGETAFECGPTFMNLKKLDLLANDGTKIESASVDIKADKIVLEATQKISMKVGSNFVVIDSSGVSIKGTMVNINTGGSADAAASAEDKDPVEPPAPDLPAQPEDPLTPAA